MLRFFSILLLIFSISNQLPAQQKLRLIFAGDVMGHAPMVKSAAIAGGKYDYRPCFKYIKPLIEQADIAVANLELTLPGKPPYTGYPMFRSPDALGEALKDAGFDLLVTANNHSNDARGTGVVKTIETVQNQGFEQTGTFKTASDRASRYPLILEKKGFKIAFLNYTYDTNGVPTDPPTIVNLIDSVQMKLDLAEARRKRPDYIFVVMHWGLEYQLTENQAQRDLARMLIRHGADMVIGAHPHVVQPIKKETVVGVGGERREALVVYSMGNFISNQKQPHTDGGILFQVDLAKKTPQSPVELFEYGFIPVWRYIHKNAAGKTTYFALPIARLEKNPKLFPEMSAAAVSKMKAYAAGVRKRLVCPEYKM